MVTSYSPNEWALMEQEAIRAWSDLFRTTRQPIREVVAQAVRDGAAVLADEFYQRMMADSRATRFLDQDQVQTRLRHSMQRWMVELFGTIQEDDLPPAIRRQVEVGVVHARIRLPIDLVSAGIRVLKRALRRRLDFAPLDAADRLTALIYVSDLLHLADSLMNLGYLRNTADVVRNDEAYRLVAQKKTSGMELTRHRAALSEWVESVLLWAWSPQASGALVPLRDSPFGIWIHHKGQVLFDRDGELIELREAIAIMDRQLLPRLRSCIGNPEKIEATVSSIKQLLDMIRFRLGELFAGISMRDEGLDSETQLPDRQYLPAILSNTMDSHQASERPFCLLLIDIDVPQHRGIQVSAGLHARLMHMAAHVLSECVRTTDHVFRFDENQFLVIAVETARQSANQLATKLVEHLRHGLQSAYVNGSITPLSPGIHVGVCEYDRHPDYQYFIQRTIDALGQSMSRTRGRRTSGTSGLMPLTTDSDGSAGG